MGQKPHENDATGAEFCPFFSVATFSRFSSLLALCLYFRPIQGVCPVDHTRIEGYRLLICTKCVLRLTSAKGNRRYITSTQTSEASDSFFHALCHLAVLGVHLGLTRRVASRATTLLCYSTLDNCCMTRVLMPSTI